MSEEAILSSIKDIDKKVEDKMDIACMARGNGEATNN